MNNIIQTNPVLQKRAEQLFEQQLARICTRTDRLFAVILNVQWLAAILTACIISPYSWDADVRTIHIHVWSAAIIGACLTLFPTYMAIRHPAKPCTRHCIAVAQALYTTLFIHLSGGRIETHFHIFGSLALLAFYRDWRVLITASVVVAIDHAVRGEIFPQSVYGVSVVSSWRWLEHAAWVLFEDLFLIRSCLQNRQEMRETAIRQAELEDMNKVSVLEQRHLANIVELTHDAIYAFDLSGTITAWNAAAAKLFGFAASDVVGQPFTVLPPDHAFPDLLQSVLDKQQISNKETVRTRKDGSTVDVEITVSSLNDELRGQKGFSVVARDITHRKEAETRIAEFYATVSHELRTPLTSIRGALTLISEGVVDVTDEEGSEMLQIARTSSDRLLRLINEILDLRKMECGKLVLQTGLVSTNAILNSVANSMRGMSAEYGVSISTEVSEDVEVDLDFDRFTQVLMNLLSNAIKFAEQDSQIELKFETIRNSYRFSVTNHGASIPADQRHKLFGKFQQLNSSDSRPRGGTGLGLAISKAIVEQHGGRIDFVSENDVTTFFVELPVRSENRRNKLEVVDAARVLVVEDDTQLCNVLHTHLAAEGISSTIVNTKQECLKYLATSEPEVVLVDLCLPDGSGIEIIDSYRCDHPDSDVKFIVMSGRSKDEGFALPLIFDYVAKPFDLSTLSSSLRRAMLDGSRQRVLIVDDDEDARTVMAARLRSLDLHCIQAQDGLQAINAIKHNSPDLVILDIGMPEVNGFQVLDWIRTQGPTTLPVLVYSGQEIEISALNSYSEELTKYLVKGCATEEQFVNAIKHLLQKVVASESYKKHAELVA